MSSSQKSREALDTSPTLEQPKSGRPAAATLASEELLPLLLEGANGYALFTIDTEGTIDSWNPGSEAVFGWRESEILGQSFAAMFTPEDRAADAPRKELEMATRDGAAPDVRWHQRNDGGRVFINGTTQSIFDRAGQLSGFLKIGRDVTAQRQAETALRKSEEKYGALFATMDEGFVFGQVIPIGDDLVDFRFEAVNPAFERLVGATSAELVGGTAREAFPGLEEAWYRVFAEVALGGQRIHREIFSEALGQRWLDSHFTPFGAPGKGGLALAVTDITERKRADEALRRREEQHRLILENVRDYALFTLDTEGLVTSWNEGLGRLSGYQESEIVGRHFRLFFPESSRTAGIPEHSLAKARQEGRMEDEGWRVRKDGTRYWTSDVLTAVRDVDGEVLGFVKIARDVTEIRLAEREKLERDRETALLAERHRMAQELHDTLAQGFTGIKLQIDLAEYALEDDDPNVTEAMRYIVRAREFAQQCQVEARRSIRALRSPLLEELTLAEALDLLVKEVSASGPITFQTQGTPVPLPALVQNDIYRIGQEAITNALRHSGSDLIAVILTYSEKDLQLVISDNGRGYEPETLAGGFGITGMGERAQRIGGELQITGTPDRGTRVCLRLELPKECDA